MLTPLAIALCAMAPKPDPPALLELEHGPTPHAVDAVTCNAGFTKCSQGANVHEAKKRHIAALEAAHGAANRSSEACSGVGNLTAGAAFSARIDVPLVGRQSVSVHGERSHFFGRARLPAFFFSVLS